MRGLQDQRRRSELNRDNLQPPARGASPTLGHCRFSPLSPAADWGVAPAMKFICNPEPVACVCMCTCVCVCVFILNQDQVVFIRTTFIEYNYLILLHLHIRLMVDTHSHNKHHQVHALSKSMLIHKIPDNTPLAFTVYHNPCTTLTQSTTHQAHCQSHSTHTHTKQHTPSSLSVSLHAHSHKATHTKLTVSFTPRTLTQSTIYQGYSQSHSIHTSTKHHTPSS